MDAETKKLLVLIRHYGNCLKNEKMPENLNMEQYKTKDRYSQTFNADAYEKQIETESRSESENPS